MSTTMTTITPTRADLDALRIADVFPHRALVRLATDVFADDPSLAPEVAAGAMSVHTWLWTREPRWRRVLLTPDDDMVGYLGVTAVPGTKPAITRLLVHPDWTGFEVRQRLVDLATNEFGPSLR